MLGVRVGYKTNNKTPAYLKPSAVANLLSHGVKDGVLLSQIMQ
jgi:hypothetical protein